MEFSCCPISCKNRANFLILGKIYVLFFIEHPTASLRAGKSILQLVRFALALFAATSAHQFPLNRKIFPSTQLHSLVMQLPSSVSMIRPGGRRQDSNFHRKINNDLKQDIGITRPGEFGFLRRNIPCCVCIFFNRNSFLLSQATRFLFIDDSQTINSAFFLIRQHSRHSPFNFLKFKRFKSFSLSHQMSFIVKSFCNSIRYY